MTRGDGSEPSGRPTPREFATSPTTNADVLSQPAMRIFAIWSLRRCSRAAGTPRSPISLSRILTRTAARSEFRPARAPRHVALSDEGRRFFERQVIGERRNAVMFVRAKGHRWKRADQQRPLATAYAKIALEDVTFHGFRHTYVSRLAMKGVPSLSLQPSWATDAALLPEINSR
jgi:integrase